MEHLINVHIEKLPEGVYPATSEDVQGLVAQGRTVAETRSAGGERCQPSRGERCLGSP
jgi:predicted RNase H-like HicB family nuclease